MPKEVFGLIKINSDQEKDERKESMHPLEN
jgi:hypothetical protein